MTRVRDHSAGARTVRRGALGAGARGARHALGVTENQSLRGKGKEATERACHTHTRRQLRSSHFQHYIMFCTETFHLLLFCVTTRARAFVSLHQPDVFLCPYPRYRYCHPGG